MKLCPWCKKKPTLSDNPDYRVAYVECRNKDCPVRPMTAHFDTSEEALKAWDSWGEK